jgi:hypothetical protein
MAFPLVVRWAVWVVSILVQGSWLVRFLFATLDGGFRVTWFESLGLAWWAVAIVGAAIALSRERAEGEASGRVSNGGPTTSGAN